MRQSGLNAKLLAAALQLIEMAFAQAAKKRWRPAQSMTLAVLNNRLLQLTDRRFKPSDYGAKNLRELLAMLAPEVTISREHQQEFVELRMAVNRPEYQSGSAPEKVREPQPLGGKAGVPSSMETGRIRRDLWMAIVDYASGRQYVWDDIRGIAREATQDDSQVRFPTITPYELDAWRGEFLDANGASLSVDEMALAQHWRDGGLSTLNLPPSLQQLWNKEMTRRVRQRLSAFFASRVAPTPTVTLTPQLPRVAGVNAEIDDQIAAARDAGEFFVVGELVARSVKLNKSNPIAPVLARIIGAWASSKGPSIEPDSMPDLIAHLGSLSDANVATALVNAIYRLRKDGEEALDGVSDLVFRLRKSVAEIYGVEDRRSPSDTCSAAVAKLETTIYEIEAAVDRFLRTTPATAKAASIDLLKLSHQLYPLLVPAERGFLRDLEILIGPAFRKLCEAYERNDDVEVLRRAPEFLANVKSHTPNSNDPRQYSDLWNAVVAPILEHLSELVEDAKSRGEVALAPILELRNRTTKADLRIVDRDILLSFSLRNSGRGHAHDISLHSVGETPTLQLSLAEPGGPFDVAPGGEQLVRIRLLLSKPAKEISTTVKWICQTPLEKEAVFDDKLIVTQQVTEVNWELLVGDPPYSLNPIRRPDRLYGRDTALHALTLASMSGASKFVWGQKRIGKTSLLQVLRTQLSERFDTTCILLRMGEVASLHEGEIGHLIAERLAECSPMSVNVPAEAEFGASIGRLVPFVELLCSQAPNRKFVVIIDEFDDLDPAFYTGERGRQFVKALRSLSEVGLTFFFVGSERMETIYRRHQADLNKWTNVRLDRIDSRTECKALIANPVANAIEFSREAVDFITDYCGGNPFYINNFCYQVFERCLQEHRTFVDDNDTDAVRHQLLRALGPTNFSHFWEDNPLLDQEERTRALAENCVALTCIAVLGGRYEDQEELDAVQDSLPLSLGDRASEGELRRACARLLARNILTGVSEKGSFVISLPIFREWLAENAVSKLLTIWTAYKELTRVAISQSASLADTDAALDFSGFTIPEDDLLAVSQRLVYCGRQKDVADIRSWLRQFDDDARIEVAFLLLKRLAEKGFINEGAKSLALARLEEMVRARRLEVGEKKWKIERGRLDNLCLTYVDSELKSGATTARELRNILRPGKGGPASDVSTWMRSHVGEDPMVVLVDDFAATGSTLVEGIQRFHGQVDPRIWQRYLSEGRISVFIMFAFPEGLEHVRRQCAGIHAVAATTLGDELRACSPDAAIFNNEGDLRFTRDVLLQLGRELYPAEPLGFGDMGLLVAFHNACPNNTLPIFWSNGVVGERNWKPIFPRA
jgi:hypothetical protein